jgi:DNA-binding NarL/FixJ family response regulator
MNASPSNSSMPASPVPPPEERCDILLVDDSPEVLGLLDRELSAAGYCVHAEASGAAALAHLARHLPEAIVLDVLMPELDGFETCRRIRAVSAEVPVLFMTGLEDTEHVVRGFAVGGNDYVTKPVAPAEVIARLRAHTRAAGLARAAREAVQASPLPLLAFTADGSVLWANAAAQRLLPGVASDADGLRANAARRALLALTAGRGEVALESDGAPLAAQRVSEAGAAVTVAALAPHRGDGAPRAPLTARESEVLSWVARGKTNRDIADILGMSPRTVNKHLEHVFEKLGVETRTAAVAAARRLRLDSDRH